MPSVGDGITPAAAPAKSALRERLVSVLSWATTTVMRARPETELWGGDHETAIRPVDKMILEASLLALVADRLEAARLPATELIEAVASRTDVVDRIYELIRWRPHLRTSLGVLWVALDHFDCGDDRQRSLLRALWESEAAPVQPHERVPYRLLDQAWVRSKVHGEVDAAISGGALFPFTSLANASGALFMNRNDLYALTHEAMYLTDFGSWSTSTSCNSEILGALTLSRILVGDLDLAAELTLADALVGHAPAANSQVIARALANGTFDRLGHLPSPTFNERELASVDDKDAYVRFHSYHTTFVYGLMCYGLTLARNSSRWEPALSTAVSSPATVSASSASSEATPLAVRVADTSNEWTLACLARGADLTQEWQAVLRHVLDAYLIQAVQTDSVDDMLRLIGMADVGGPSLTDRAARTYLDTRAHLGDASPGSREPAREGEGL